MTSRIDVAMTRPRPRPASHANKPCDDDTDDERGVTRTYALRCDDFFASFGVVTDRER